MRRTIVYIALAAVVAALVVAGLILGNRYWIHRYDELILRHASVYRIEPRLVWSVIYEETYFRSTVIGDAQEVGLMQVTPTVAKEWAKATGLKEFELQTQDGARELLSDPEKNIQIGCWYLEQLSEKFRDMPAAVAMTLAAYNAGPSRVEEWTAGVEKSSLSEEEFIERIGIGSTKQYVKSILKRYREN